VKLRWLIRHYLCQDNPLGPTRIRQVAQEKVLQVWDFPTQSWHDVPTVFDQESYDKAKREQHDPSAKVRKG
jgi:hypothetical protein